MTKPGNKRRRRRKQKWRGIKRAPGRQANHIQGRILVSLKREVWRRVIDLKAPESSKLIDEVRRSYGHDMAEALEHERQKAVSKFWQART